MVVATRTPLEETSRLFRQLHAKRENFSVVGSPPILGSIGTSLGDGHHSIKTDLNGVRRYGGVHKVVVDGRPIFLVIFQGGARPDLKAEEVERVYGIQAQMTGKHAQTARLPMGEEVYEQVSGYIYQGLPWGLVGTNLKWLELVTDATWAHTNFLDADKFLMGNCDWAGVYSYLRMEFIPLDPIGPRLDSDFSKREEAQHDNTSVS